MGLNGDVEQNGSQIRIQNEKLNIHMSPAEFDDSSILQFHVAVLKLSEDDEFDSMRPYQFDHFKPLEYELVIYVDVPATNPYYWGSVKMTFGDDTVLVSGQE
ncbi:hypothetical protein V9T40_010774 [Parthenolecanium corni]|uniref:Uncharacterized protein n=1 Tax=Parthenolecanium corni TaxID=536013 RepID=A0AAN9XYU4_9HEMI